MPDDATVERAFRVANERYAELGVDVAGGLERLRRISISLPCWQGDDVGGIENNSGLTGGGIQATGNYPGKARSADELRSDFECALRMIPGQHRFNLHAIYAETGGRTIERDELAPEHFAGWIAWAKEQRLGLDFNPTFFSHRLAADGFTLASGDRGARQFWVRHGSACRRIGATMGRELGTSCVTNVWIPDGFKDIPADRKTPRCRLRESLDEIFAEPLDPRHNLDSVEGKLFGLGSESYVVGSHEFYLGYAIANKKLLCIDSGHYHPTESVADKLSAVLEFVAEILLHISRGVRWDSDHVPILSDELRAIAEELVRGGLLDRVHIGLDYFDASINRVAAWVIGARAMLQALLIALLEPIEKLRTLEAAGDFTARLALLEETKTLPFGAVWDYYCQKQGAPIGGAFVAHVKQYEREVLAVRDPA
jgi:L-rhamnose isomerase